jgi:hypothetical protein
VAHGNFVLSELELCVDDQPIKLAGVEASFSQSKFSYEKAVDGKLDTGWAVSPQMGKGHYARFRLFEPRTVPSDARLTIRLRQHHGSRHSIGRFRVRLVTGVEGDEFAPEKIRTIVLRDDTERTVDQRRELSEHYFRTQVAATRSLYRELDELTKKAPAKPVMRVRVISARSQPRETRVFDRGDFLSPGNVVVPSGLSALPPMIDHDDDGLNRLDLARWLFDPENPLPPRVLANHVWSHLFGSGLVQTANDFGVRGQPPTHPELLDWLAGEYRRVGWSRKRLIKSIVMSSTYQQSSRHRSELSDTDPQNLLLASQNRFRVPAEVIRDLCLSVSGLLSKKVGGPSVYPFLPADVAALSYANNFKWQTSSGGDRYRRGMYTFFKRTAPHPNLTTFDCPDSNTTSISRRTSNTPLQALTLLNNDVFVEAAQALASRALAVDANDDVQRMTVLLRHCLARTPSDFEVQRFVSLLDQSRTWYAENEQEAQRIASRHQPAQTDEREAAAWVSVARIVLNLDEFITRE